MFSQEKGVAQSSREDLLLALKVEVVLFGGPYGRIMEGYILFISTKT